MKEKLLPLIVLTILLLPLSFAATRPFGTIITNSLSYGNNVITATFTDPDGDLLAKYTYIFIKSPSTSSTYNKVYSQKMKCSFTRGTSEMTCSYNVNVDDSWGDDAKIAVIASDNFNYGKYSYKIIKVMPKPQGSTPSNPSTKTKPSSAECTDTDGGKDYYVKGTVTVAAGSKSDQCGPGNYLFEAYCNNGKFAWDTHYCKYGCSNGACKKATESSCTDTDGGKDPFVAGSVSYMNLNGVASVLKDYCSGPNLVEYYCSNNKMFRTLYSCAYGCKNGACLRSPAPKKTCEDTDNGLEYNKKGTVKDKYHSRSYTDYCYSDKLLSEYYCLNGRVSYTYHTCKYGCEDGACLTANPNTGNNPASGSSSNNGNSQLSCQDTDITAKNPYEVKGTVTLAIFNDNVKQETRFTDVCLKDKSNHLLLEYTCSKSGLPLAIYHNCQGSCNDGACHPSAIPIPMQTPGLEVTDADRCEYYKDKLKLKKHSLTRQGFSFAESPSSLELYHLNEVMSKYFNKNEKPVWWRRWFIRARVYDQRTDERDIYTEVVHLSKILYDSDNTADLIKLEKQANSVLDRIGKKDNTIFSYWSDKEDYYYYKLMVKKYCDKEDVQLTLFSKPDQQWCKIEVNNLATYQAIQNLYKEEFEKWGTQQPYDYKNDILRIEDRMARYGGGCLGVKPTIDPTKTKKYKKAKERIYHYAEYGIDMKADDLCAFDTKWLETLQGEYRFGETSSEKQFLGYLQDRKAKFCGADGKIEKCKQWVIWREETKDTSQHNINRKITSHISTKTTSCLTSLSSDEVKRFAQKMIDYYSQRKKDALSEERLSEYEKQRIAQRYDSLIAKYKKVLDTGNINSII